MSQIHDCDDDDNEAYLSRRRQRPTKNINCICKLAKNRWGKKKKTLTGPCKTIIFSSMYVLVLTGKITVCVKQSVPLCDVRCLKKTYRHDYTVQVLELHLNGQITIANEMIINENISMQGKRTKVKGFTE